MPSTLEAAPLMQGDGLAAVSVPGSPDKKGEKVPAKTALDLKYERLSGNIMKYEAANGWGLVTSKMFPGEVIFRTERVMPEFQNHPFQDGEAVEFDVQADDHGRAHAVMLKPMVGRTPHECLGQRHRGYVRRCAERWGFLNSAAFDGDLFVHRDNLLLAPDQIVEGQPPLRSGQAVEFDVALDDRGRAVARQITTHALPRPWDWIGHRLRGHVRSFQGAWGFIISDRFAGDLFVHRDSFLAQFQGTQITQGTVVEFDVERDQRRKGAKDRLVARRVAILAPGEPSAVMGQVMPQQQHMAGAMHQPLPMDPNAYGLNPQAAQFAPSQTAPMYYPNQNLMPDASAMSPYAQPYPYAQAPYLQQPMMQPQQPLPPMQPQVLPQQAYGQLPYPSQYQLPVPQQPQLPMPQVPTQANAYLPQGVSPATEAVQPMSQALSPSVIQPAPIQPTMPKPPEVGDAPGGAVPMATDGQPQGLLHITMHDWEPDQQGQLWVTKGTLVNVSYRAAHGWVYAGTATPGTENVEPASEGWIPQAVVKRVSLCRVAMDWPAEGTGTLGVSKGEVIAVSKEAERGWVYGERIGPRQPDRAVDGWLPKKVLDYLQS
jgi:cold shock CspA family protein